MTVGKMTKISEKPEKNVEYRPGNFKKSYGLYHYDLVNILIYAGKSA